MPLFSQAGAALRMFILAVAMLAGCAEQQSADTVVVYAASSMQRAVDDVIRQFRATGGDSVVVVFGSTTDLAEQIVNGAPADVILAADEHTIDRLGARQHLMDSTRVVYATGQLALVSSCGAGTVSSGTNSRECTALSLTDLARPDVRYIAIANPSYAPYGVAAQQVLERAGLWSRVERKLVIGANIAQADQFVTSGNADAGLVAMSLVIGTTGRVFVPVDPRLHDPLRHTAAVVRRSRNVDGASRLLRFLVSTAGQASLARYGFAPPDSLTIQ